MIVPYDPFHADRMVYTIRSHVVEEPDYLYDDGAKTVILYMYGTKGNTTQELRQMLYYFGETTRESAVNENLLRIQDMVDHVKLDKEVNEEFMKSWERAQMIEEEAREAGWNAGFEKGIEKGKEKGLEEGIKKGREEERKNTEREKRRADEAEEKYMEAVKRIQEMEKRLTDLEQRL